MRDFSGINGFVECNRNCARGRNISEVSVKEKVVTVGAMVSAETATDSSLLS